MDRFIKKQTSGRRRSKPEIREQPREMKQATLESLKRVVIVEDILQSKSILSTPDQSIDILLSELAKLRPKIPSVEVLQNTKLGVVLKKLTKHDDVGVSRSALNLVNSWKADIRERRTKTTIDVRCDARTDSSRKEARRLLLDSLSGKKEAKSKLDLDELTNIVEEIEREVFTICNRKTNDSYRKTSKKIVFSLRHRSDLRQLIIDKKTSLKNLVMANLQK